MSTSASLKVVFVDVREPGFLGWSWRVGAKIFQFVHGGAVVGVSTTEEVYAYLRSVLVSGKLIEHAQFYGHARPGSMLVAGSRLDPKRLEWRACSGGLLWFRGCSTLQGQKGQNYARDFGAHGADVAGNLAVVGPWGMHSHLVAVHAGEQPWWDAGLMPGPSRPWSPRTIPAWQMKLPEWAFKKD